MIKKIHLIFNHGNIIEKTSNETKIRNMDKFKIKRAQRIDTHVNRSRKYDIILQNDKRRPISIKKAVDRSSISKSINYK